MMIRENAQSLYERIGGEAQVRRLVQRFYQYMDEQSSAATIRAMHPKDLHTSEEKLFMFLSCKSSFKKYLSFRLKCTPSCLVF